MTQLEDGIRWQVVDYKDHDYCRVEAQLDSCCESTHVDTFTMKLSNSKELFEDNAVWRTCVELQQNLILKVKVNYLYEKRVEKLEKDSTTDQGWVKWLANQIGV